MSDSINNNRNEWIALKARVDKLAAANQLDEIIDVESNVDGVKGKEATKKFIINVKVSGRTVDEENDIALLLYAFPIFDVVRNCARVKGVLNIIFNDKDEQSISAMTFKLAHYFYIQICFRESVKITINGAKVPIRPTNFGKIPPIMSFTNRPNTAFYYKNIYTVVKDAEFFSDYITFLKNYMENEDNKKRQNALNTNEYKKLIKTKYINKDFTSKYKNKNKDKDTDKVSLENMWSFCDEKKLKQTDVTADEIYFKMFLSNVGYIVQEQIVGRKGSSKEYEEKKAVIDCFAKFVLDFCWNIPVLAQYLWSVIIRYSFENHKKVYKGSIDLNAMQEYLQTTLQNATAYADCIYQIIENSCFHTATKNAYFAMRIYNVDRDVNFEKAIKANELLVSLNKVFEEYDFDGQASKLYLKLMLIDDAYDKEKRETVGILNSFNAKRGTKIDSIMDLFNLEPETKEDLSVHYGLRVLKKIVSVNQGYMIVSSANADHSYRVNYKSETIGNNNPDEDVIEKTYGGTEYTILLPFGVRNLPKNDKQEETELFDTSDILNEDIRTIKIDLNTDSSYTSKAQFQEEKDQIVNEIYSQIVKGIEKHDSKDAIFCFHYENMEYYEIELFVKALMRYAIREKDENKPDTNNEKQRFAVLFDDAKHIHEFIRIYSIFFNKRGKTYNRFSLDNTQIALCSMRKEEINGQDCNVPEVNMVLAGDDIATARSSLKKYAYYNSEASLEFIPTISYITMTERECDKQNTPKSNKQSTDIFPFELYMDLCDFSKKEDDANPSIVRENRTWFLNRMDILLNRDMRRTEFGCKIDNIHVSMGSKIRVDSFYNAEILFHNYGNSYRFAYLVAREILREHITKNKVKKLALRIISYEAYSSLFAQNVCHIIEKYADKKSIKADVDFMVYSANSERMDSDQNEYFWKEMENFVQIVNANNNTDTKGKDEYTLHILLPIATTLGALAKIQDTAKSISREHSQQKELKFGKNFAVVVVGGIIDKAGVKMGYWQSVDKDHKKITVNYHDDYKNEIISNDVRYYLNPPCLWWDGKEIIKLERNEQIEKAEQKCLIGVDKNSTVPDVIFEQYESNKENFDKLSYSGEAQNDSDKYGRIKLLKDADCINYSHICDSGNHFQFAIDYYKLCKSKEFAKELERWLKKVKKRIDTNAYNIIVSPVDITSSVFLQLVIQKSFDNCSRLLHININDSYKESIRNKFSYFQKEIKTINKTSVDMKVNVYYVDDCISTGHSLQRGITFMRMLLADSGFSNDRVSIYKGIIVIANRSSYDTMETFLPGRVKEDFFYFMRLNVPMYNTFNGKCPGCVLQEKY